MNYSTIAGASAIALASASGKNSGKKIICFNQNTSSVCKI